MHRHYLISYDIGNDLRLRRVHAVVRDFAEPVQYSVFLGRLSSSQKAELERRLGHIVHAEQDQVLLFDLGKVKGQHEILPPEYVVIGRPLQISTSRTILV